MLALPELQHLFGQALLTDDEAALSALEPEIAAGSHVRHASGSPSIATMCLRH